jgi:DNA repair exonuclease SbcCD ATPase subunit
MLKLLSMKVEGFCSIQSLDIQLDQNKIILIKAANGFGKSSIFSALIWGLYGKTIKGVSDVQTWKEYQPKDYKGVMVTVNFQKDDHIYKLTRCQKYDGLLDDGYKGKDRLVLIKDAEMVDTRIKSHLQQEIVDILGLSQRLFTNSIMFGQGINNLIQESNADKKKLFEEIFDLDYINTARNLAIEARSKVNEEVTKLKNKAYSISKTIEADKETYNDLAKREKNHNDRIKAEIKECREDKKKMLATKAEWEAQIGESKEKEIESTKETIAHLKSKYTEAKTISNIPIRKFMENVYALIQNKEYKEASGKLLKIIGSFRDMDSLQEKIDKYEGKLSKFQDEEHKYRQFRLKLEDIEEDLEYVDKQIKKLKASKLEILSTKYKAKVKEEKAALSELNGQLELKIKELEDYNWVIEDPLGNNGIKAYLFDSSLGFLNDELERYSNILGFRISFEIDLSTARKDFVTLIEKDNHIIEYDELSGGEKQLVNISIALAMNKALTLSKGINIAFMDEVFESLSSDNVELVIQLVKEVYSDRTLFLISHHDNLPFSNAKILTVTKEKGLSHYQGL